MSTADEISGMFLAESEKLEKMINAADGQEMSVPQTVETYYQVINVSSMAAMLKQTAGTQKALLEKIAETETMISNRFNSAVHPKVMAHLKDSILQCTQKLQSDPPEKTGQAGLYEELRQKMSTKEFVDQYGQGLHDD